VTPGPLPIDAGLLARFRAAARAIAWRPGTTRPRAAKGHRVRIAHLHDEDARVESWGTEARGGVAVDSGPVGALVLLLEADRRGPPTTLGAEEAGRNPAFPSGALVAAWGPGDVPQDSHPRLEDLVELARYALA
jgi:hypothetical protein